MKATGIVRRIDDLGRVVIPKEIRRTLHIKEGDQLEIYTDNDGGVTFKKYVSDDTRVEMIMRGMTETAKILEQPVLLARSDGTIFTYAGFDSAHIPPVDVMGGKLAREVNAPFCGLVYLPSEETTVVQHGVDTNLYVQAVAKIPIYPDLGEESNYVTAILCLSNKPVEVLPPSVFKVFQLAVTLLSGLPE
mgnify:CR=1 FL=1